MKKFFLVALTVIAFTIRYFPITLPPGQPRTAYSIIPDAEADFLVSLRVSQGEGLYSSFSIVYPPGRFFLQAILFHLIGPTFPVTGLAHVSEGHVIFPALLFVLAFIFFERLIEDQASTKLKYYSVLISYPLAMLTGILYLVFIRSAQETHIIAAIFFSVLLMPGKLDRWKVFILGLLYGLTFLFRIDGGILLTLSIVAALVANPIKEARVLLKKTKEFLFGFAVVWIPTLLLILLNGSLKNFLYDTLILGLILQPRTMGLPIPENDFGLVFLSSLILLVGLSIALFVDASNLKDKMTALGIRALAVFSALSYVSALGRSDEPHLWYGLLWLPLLLTYGLFRFGQTILKREKVSISTVVITAIITYLFSWGMIQIKAPTVYLLGTVGLFLLLRKSSNSIVSILIASVVTSLFVFHSWTYFKPKLGFPWPPTYYPLTYDWLTNEPPEIGGLVIEDASRVVLDQVRADIPEDEQYLFIFPKNLLLNEYLHLKNPHRYTYLTLERSEATEQEILDRLEQTQTKYFLVFTKEATLRSGPAWDWILANTTPVKKYQFGLEEAELRTRNP